MAKQQVQSQSNSKSVQYPSPILGGEIVILGCQVNINYRYKERAIVDGDIQIDSDEKSDSMWFSIQSFDESGNPIEDEGQDEILSIAIAKAKEKSSAAITQLAEKITQARTQEKQ